MAVGDGGHSGSPPQGISSPASLTSGTFPGREGNAAAGRLSHDGTVRGYEPGPHHPGPPAELLDAYQTLLKATRIEHDWERAKPHIAEWERDANTSPAILAAWARRYSELGRYDEAQRALTRYIRFSPDYWAYDQIAKNYKGTWRLGALAIDP
jgi:tetratricopeptide (TPR) repeat protein